jgi:disulfide oxidoreductase YuzD
MKQNNVDITVYGTEQICSSCVGLPSSKDTFEWLYAAITRKFPNQHFHFLYVDIMNPPQDPFIQEFARKVISEDMLYPVVVVNGKVVGEGNPRLKPIFSELKKSGYIEGNF